MPKIVISNCWSYYNKGDAAIALATAEYIHSKFENSEITLLAVDSQSFIDNNKNLNYPINILPMIHRIEPFRAIGKMYSGAFHYLNGVFSYFGLVYLIIQILCLMILSHISSVCHEISSEIENADLVIGVGGNYLWSNEGLYNHLIPLMYAKYIKKKKVVLLGHSIGPFNNRIDRLMIGLLLNKTDLTVFREKVSYQYIVDNSITVSNNLVLSDLAFLLKPIFKDSYSKKPIIGFTIRKWLKKKPILFNNYIHAIVKLIEKLCDEGNNVYLIPFSYLPGEENDVEICNKVLELIKEDYRENIKRLDFKNLTPNQIIEKLSDLEISILVGTRLHSIILASLANIPSVIFSYQHFKALGISKQLGIREYLIKIEEVDYENLEHKFELLSAQHQLIKSEMKQAIVNTRTELGIKVEKIIATLTQNSEVSNYVK